MGNYKKAKGGENCPRQKEFKDHEDSASGGDKSEEKRQRNDCELADKEKV